MHSIKQRMVLYFMFIIIITVIILESFLITSIRQNYYKSLEDSLLHQLQTSAELYVRYFSDASLEENIANNVDTFWKQVAAQVEIIDMQGHMLMNSRGTLSDPGPQMQDVRTALEGKKSTWIGYTTERVMAASYPLQVEQKQIGVLRFIASLSEVDQEIEDIAVRYLSFGGLVVLFSGFVSILLARTITEPLKKVTRTAEAMASGNYNVKSAHQSKDEIGKLSATLNYLASEIIKKDQLKNDFISSVSHELRTPLTSIKGWAITLKQYENQDILQDGLNIIENESDRLTHMVAELLDFSRFVSGKVTLKRENVHIPTLLKQLHIQLSPRAIRDKIDFQINISPDINELCTDGNRLKQVFINLIDNAFNFTPSGGKITLAAAAGHNQYIFTVRDTGCGISENELPRIKDKFYKGKSSKSQNGIGLSISDEIIRLMHGRLDITSTQGEGTTVTVILPHKEESDDD